MQSSSSSSSSSSSPHFLSSFLPKTCHHLFYIPITALSCLLLFLLSLSPHFPPPTNPNPNPNSPPRLPNPPSFAYLLSASANDSDRLLNLLLAIYHPKNTYLLHLDLSASRQERARLARDLDAFPAFRFRGNVHVVGRADFVNPRGCSALASLLRGAAVLLRVDGRWDWFVNLGVDDYPLVTQDGMVL